MDAPMYKIRELDKCPFCGGRAGAYEERLFIMGNASMKIVKCENCGGAYIDDNKEHCLNDVIDGWNRRVE